MVSEALDSQNNWFKDFFKDFTVSNNLDLKDLTSAELFFKDLWTYNNYQGYCLDSLWTLWDLDLLIHLLHCIPWTFLHYFLKWKGKYINKRWIWTICWVFLMDTCSRYPSQGTQVMLNQDKETKKVWTIQPKPSQRSSLRSSTGKVQECSLTQWLHIQTSCTCAALHSGRGAAQRSSGQQQQQGGWGASLWYAGCIIQ